MKGSAKITIWKNVFLNLTQKNYKKSIFFKKQDVLQTQ